MMKKIFFAYICIGFSCLAFSQTNNQLSQLRNTYQQLQVLSPSPEMRNMIRFDNVEVSSYTGTPDINIPLFAFECTKDLNFTIALKYHPDAIKKEERAGSTGLGWSLFAGGSIARVVRGMPDESVKSDANGPRFGLYKIGNKELGNDLDDFIDNQSFNVGTGDRLSLHDKLFEALESGTYDTQYDLYYYNFMGYSGSFYVKMSNSGNLTIVKLEDNPLKISANRESFNPDDPNDPNRLKISSFSVFDENGNKFFFDVKETTSTTKGYRMFKMFSSSNVWENLNDGDGVIPMQNINEVVTAYHLTNITPYTHVEPILTFSYTENFESYQDFTFVMNKLISPSPTLSDQSYYQYINSQLNVAERDGWTKMRTQFGNSKAYYTNWIKVNSKKLQRINYNNKLYVNFTYETGRTDANYLSNNLTKLSNIEIHSADPPINFIRPTLRNKKLIKQFRLNYIQAQYNDKKMLLKDVIEYKNTVTDELVKKYKMYYNAESSFLPNLYEDPWGYSTNVNPEYNEPTTNINFIKTFVLEKLELPTGGAVVYNYEPHVYSYIGDRALIVDSFSQTRKNEIGGGIRIKNIGFFDEKSVSQNYYTNNLSSPIPTKEFTYNYELPGENLSSGSLSFPTPVFKYQRNYELYGDFAKRISPSTSTTDYLQPNHTDLFKYEIFTNYNNLHTLTTKGANIGYKNVTITERNNGKKILTFTSPIDFPEENYTITYPFIPSKNVDYKRGLLLNQKNYNSDNILISETINTYDYKQNEVNIGIIPFYKHGHNCLKTVCQETGWIRAGLINTNQSNCHNGYPMLGSVNAYYQSKPYCTSTTELMNYKLEKRVVGWAKLSKSERIDYLPNAINTVKEYTYNSINKKPSTIKNIIGSDFYSTHYEYLNAYESGSIIRQFPNRYNRISDVKNVITKLNNEILSTENVSFKDINPENSDTNFRAVDSHIYVPEKYQYAKGNNVLEDIQVISRMDDRGNPLEIKKADGTITAFIWGHNKTRLVAIIENCQFSEIETLAVYTSIVSSTNSNLTTAVKTNLLNHYNTLRTSLPAKSQMTALIHDMGLGVVSKIDPNGKIIYYNYNDIGNLQEIKDNENNLLKQYFEFYKN